jgi:geranylgeranyl reductase family protein
LQKGLRFVVPEFDFVVGGGSIAGLAFANEVRKNGPSVLVLEEHEEIGEPEKCDGLVSLRGLRRFGYEPTSGVIQNKISSAIIHSPRGRRFAVNASALDVVVLRRSAYDKEVAMEARSRGAEIRTGKRVAGVTESEQVASVRVDGHVISSRYYVDATGPSSSPRHGILPPSKCEVEGDWIREQVVEVFLDADRYPGFFAWVIPYGRHRAKVGAAGFGVSPFRALEEFLSDRPTKILRKIAAPIYIGGPAELFVKGRTILVGESAGQVKPTTAGGILTSIAGAVSAARWASESLKRGQPRLLARYQREWESHFLREMKAMLRLRMVLEKLSNADLEAVFDVLATPKLTLKLSQTDFDFHASALLGALGVQGLIKLAKVVASSEVRSVLLQT